MTSSRGRDDWNPWNYRPSAKMTEMTVDLAGFTVVAQDGEIGKVDEATNDVGASYIVVDTGPWIFGSKVVLPAGTVERVARDDRRVYIRRSRDEIKNAPKFDKDTYTSPDYRDRLGEYYGRFR